MSIRVRTLNAFAHHLGTSPTTTFNYVAGAYWEIEDGFINVFNNEDELLATVRNWESVERVSE